MTTASHTLRFLTLGTVLTLPQFAQEQFRQVSTCAAPNCITSTVLPPGPLDDGGLAAGDFDSDGDVDFVSVGSQGLFYLQNEMRLSGTPGFGDYTWNTNGINNLLTLATDVAAGDLDGDGDPDVVISTAFSSVRVSFVSQAPGSGFVLDDGAVAGWGEPVNPAANTIGLGDFNGDGVLDVIQGGPTGLTLWLNRLPGGVVNLVDYTAQTVGGLPLNTVFDLVVGDFDGDGDLDVATAGIDPATGLAERFVLLNPGGIGAWAATAMPAIAGEPRCITAGDFDTDGDLDLAYGQAAFINAAQTGYVDGTLVLLENVGGAALMANPLVAVGTQATFTDLTVGDTNEDGVVEVLASTEETPSGTPAFAPLPGRTAVYQQGAGLLYVDLTVVEDDTLGAGALPSDGRAIVAVDVDFDLDLDLMVAHRNGATPGLFTNHLWQLEAPRTVPGPGTGFTITYDLYTEFGTQFAPGNHIAVVAVSTTAPTHSLTPTPFGIAAITSNYVTVASNFYPDQGALPVTFSAAMIGTQIFAQAALISSTTGEIRLSNVVMTTFN